MRKSTSRLVALLMSVMMLVTMVAPVAASAETYESAYASKQEAKEAGLLMNLQIASEGMVLLKNNGTLPLEKNAKISVFGYASSAPLGGGDPSAAETSGGIVKLQSDIHSSLADAGFEVNPTVKASYDAWKANEEIATDAAIAAANLADEQAKWEETFAQYSDAGIVVLSHGSDTFQATAGLANVSLAYDEEQYALIDYVAEKFENVIVLINSTKPHEITPLKNNDKVDAVLVVGEPGDNGFDALGKILDGEVNPSGRTSDTWAADFTQDPIYPNYNIESDDLYGYGRYTVDGEMTNTYFVEYEEGIYVGYRYWETRGYEEAKKGNEGWYDEHVTYTFGSGLSYTTFDWAVKPVVAADSVITKDTELAFEVTVTNTGDVAGKDVVQLYYTAPYGEETTNPTKIEKPYVVLADYAKTKELAPGESETVTLTVKASEMASYDYVTDKTYVLDDGAYGLKIAKNAHDVVETVNYTVAAKELCNIASTGYEITNQLDDVTEGYTEMTDKRLSRADFEGTFPTAGVETIELTAEEHAAWDFSVSNTDDPADPWYTDVMPTQADAATRPEKAEIMLADMVGKSADDPDWEKLIDQLTIEEMTELINNGNFKSINMDYIGKPYAKDTDGPKGWTGSGTDSADSFNMFAAAPMISGTWNKELLYEMGVIIGEQGIWGNATQESGMAYNYTGWYAPAMNIHRSVFDTRFTEYYSEDPVLSGETASAITQGAKTKGVYTSLKHFPFHEDGGGIATTWNADGSFNVVGYRGAMNSDQTAGLSVWIDEQAAREIYLKGYQIAVEEGDATFAMSSFSRAGTTWCGGSYAINTEILRNEWGFDGAIVTDICLYGHLNCDQMIRSGADMLMSSMPLPIMIGQSEYTATQVTAMRNATKHILYMVANSNAMQLPKGAKVVYAMPTTVNAEGDTVELEIPAAKAGEAYETPALNTATLNTYGAFAELGYTAENLPEGLTFDAATGVISGTPTTAGTYTVTVTAAAEGYVPASVDYTIVVE